MNPLLKGIIIGVVAAAIRDLKGYADARARWKADPITNSEPAFDWQLFTISVLIGAASGAGLGSAL